MFVVTIHFVFTLHATFIIALSYATFIIDSLCVFRYTVIPSTRKCIKVYFPICIPLIDFFYPIALTRTSSMM